MDHGCEMYSDKEKVEEYSQSMNMLIAAIAKGEAAGQEYLIQVNLWHFLMGCMTCCIIHRP